MYVLYNNLENYSTYVFEFICPISNSPYILQGYTYARYLNPCTQNKGRVAYPLDHCANTVSPTVPETCYFLVTAKNMAFLNERKNIFI